ncbi:MAG: hypothetical protein U9Q81_16430 [Pseudomonadota bacterium]|nr:hypothetical protein [Pseudomonadota bacterium]
MANMVTWIGPSHGASLQAASTVVAAFFGNRISWSAIGKRASAAMACALAPRSQDVSGSLIPRRIAAWCSSYAITR